MLAQQMRHDASNHITVKMIAMAINRIWPALLPCCYPLQQSPTDDQPHQKLPGHMTQGLLWLVCTLLNASQVMEGRNAETFPMLHAESRTGPKHRHG